MVVKPGGELRVCGGAVHVPLAMAHVHGARVPCAHKVLGQLRPDGQPCAVGQRRIQLIHQGVRPHDVKVNGRGRGTVLRQQLQRHLTVLRLTPLQAAAVIARRPAQHSVKVGPAGRGRLDGIHVGVVEARWRAALQQLHQRVQLPVLGVDDGRGRRRPHAVQRRRGVQLQTVALACSGGSVWREALAAVGKVGGGRLFADGPVL